MAGLIPDRQRMLGSLPEAEFGRRKVGMRSLGRGERSGGQGERERRRSAARGGSHGAGLGRPGMGNCGGAELTEDAGSVGVGFSFLVRRTSCGRAGSARGGKRLEKAIGRKCRFTEIRQAEIRPAEIPDRN